MDLQLFGSLQQPDGSEQLDRIRRVVKKVVKKIRIISLICLLKVFNDSLVLKNINNTLINKLYVNENVI